MDSQGRQVALICEAGRWQAVMDGPCEPRQLPDATVGTDGSAALGCNAPTQVVPLSRLSETVGCACFTSDRICHLDSTNGMFGFECSMGQWRVFMDGVCGKPNPPTIPLPLSNAKFVLRPDRMCNRDRAGQFPPSQPLDEAIYHVVGDSATTTFSVSFSADAKTVTLVDPYSDASAGVIQGTLSSTSAAFRTYQLHAWAGGLFTVWTQDNPLVGEVIKYGSGVPVVSCERGTLRTE
jgi:hypothetical protein